MTDSTFTGLSERSKVAMQQAESLIEISRDTTHLTNFDDFAADLISTLETTFSRSKGRTSSFVVARQRLWTEFHSVRSSVLVDVWNKFLKSVGVTRLDPLIQQYINQKLYEDIVKSHYATQPRISTRKSSLLPDEENIIRYASGYVPMVLMKRHEKNVSKKSVAFIECLGNMAVNGEDSTLLEYTTQWVSKVNRGGLFEINDMAYLLFREIENNLRDKLTYQLHPSSALSELDKKEQLVSTALNDDNVQFYWTMLSTDIDDEQDSMELLREIIELWLTIRGHSIAGQWMEIYKRS